MEKKGFSVSDLEEDAVIENTDGLVKDSMKFATKPIKVLLTGNAQFRLMPIFKLNFNKKTKEYITGSLNYHTIYAYNSNSDSYETDNFMPGFAACYGYNFVNVGHFDFQTQQSHNLFTSHVLVRTLYYPSFYQDSLNMKPINRNHYLISVYDEDTNQDGFINVKDLRRLYAFDLIGQNKSLIIPKEYSVLSSEYDSENDVMYVFTKHDSNKNGQMEITESTHIFWVDLKNPEKHGRMD